MRNSKFHKRKVDALSSQFSTRYAMINREAVGEIEAKPETLTSGKQREVRD
jgi:hypothetical protein